MKIKQLTALVSLLFFSGCTLNENHYGVKMETIYITAYKNEWKVTNKRSGNQGHYMYQEFSFLEINDAVLDKGAVFVYYIDAAKRDNILPLVLPYEGSSVGRDLTENIRYESEYGILTLIIECSDFSSAPRTSDMLFKVCILRE